MVKKDEKTTVLNFTLSH